MRKSNWLLAALVMTMNSAAPQVSFASAPPLCRVHSGTLVMPLVELYTSEGCSSCPPADRWLSRVYAQHAANFLAFHVDYWNRLGWPDRFASPKYSERQRQRVNAAGEHAVYTPQVMIGGQTQVDWRFDAAFARALAAERQPATINLSVSMDSAAAGASVRVEATRLQPANGEPTEVWLAQYSDAEISRVDSGENAGETLRHDRVVRQLWGPWTMGREPITQSVELQQALAKGGLTAFAQDQYGSVQQSLSLAGANCAGVQQ